MKDILKLCISLGLICLVSAALLGYVEQKTLEPRQAAAKKSMQQKLSLILPKETAGTGDSKVIGDVEFIPALDNNGKVIAYAARSSASGFGGAVAVLASIDRKGAILGVIVDKHNETPGIGSQVTERKQPQSLWKTLFGKAVVNPFPPNRYLDSFAGRNLANGAFIRGGNEKNSMQTVSGATISSKAVLKAMNQIREVYRTSTADGLLIEK